LLLPTTKTKTQTSDAAALADFAKAIKFRGVAGGLMRLLLGGAPLLRYEEWLSIATP
jgi:predicted lipid-binding transport protein (Tim44 family)